MSDPALIRNPDIIEAATRAMEEFRQAFVVAVGDQSPFAKQALLRADAALAALPLIEAAALERAAQMVEGLGGVDDEEWAVIAQDIRALIIPPKEQP
jgi:hypothetical protein